MNDELTIESGFKCLLSHMTKKELYNIANRINRSMTQGDGYQPFGYDSRTMRAVHPIDWPVYLAVCRMLEYKLHSELDSVYNVKLIGG